MSIFDPYLYNYSLVYETATAEWELIMLKQEIQA